MNAAAAVRLVFTHGVSGALVAGKAKRCVRRTRTNRKSPRCTRTLTDGTLMFKAAAGVNKVHFEGRLDVKDALKPGRYTVTATAIDPAGHPTAPRKLTFTILTVRRTPK